MASPDTIIIAKNNFGQMSPQTVDDSHYTQQVIANEHIFDKQDKCTSFPACDLAKLQCPFQTTDGSSCPQQTNGCPFGHRKRTSDKETQMLRPIPSNFCLDHLLDQCQRTPTCIATPNTPEQSWCFMGFHPVDLNDFDRIVMDLGEQKRVDLCVKNGKQEHIKKLSLKEPDSKENLEFMRNSCKLCYKLVGLETQQPFGLLENCPHSFCYKCISENQNQARSYKCPQCKVVSERILIWPSCILSENMKVELLDALQWSICKQSTYQRKLLPHIPDAAFLCVLIAFCGVLVVINFLK